MIQRYDPIVEYAEYTGDVEAGMSKCNYGDFVRYDEHMREITKLQERIAELEINRDGGYYGDV